MASLALNSYLNQVIERALPNGGFADQVGSQIRPDATAWSMIVLRNQEGISKDLKRAGDQLLGFQMSDGRVVISRDHPDALWPTPLAILAWHNSQGHLDAWTQAVNFLIKTTGVHWEKSGIDVVGHDTVIPGWPWIADTHSWVVPTSMAMIALTVTGFGDHERVKAGERLLMNRQIPGGGWNYGNTSVLGKELRPFPETTGIALNALAGRVPRDSVEPSIQYLQEQVPTLRTPLSLGWAILGLKAWNVAPGEAHDWIVDTLERGHLYGGYNTASLCVLLAADLTSGGLGSLMTQES